MKSTRTILLMDEKEDSQVASDLLLENQIPFEILPRDSIWEEIEWPIPTLFYKGEVAYKGLPQIKEAIDVLNPAN